MVEVAQIISISINQNIIHLEFRHVLKAQNLGHFSSNRGLELIIQGVIILAHLSRSDVSFNDDKLGIRVESFLGPIDEGVHPRVPEHNKRRYLIKVRTLSLCTAKDLDSLLAASERLL